MSETEFYLSQTTIVANGINTGNVSINLDLLKRWPYLVPSTSNAATITAGLTRMANTYLNNQSGAFWSNVARYDGISVVSGAAAGGNGYTGGVILQDGRIIFSPWNGQGIGIYNMKTRTFTSVAHGWGAGPGLEGAVLLPDGRVAMGPNGTWMGFFNPVTNAVTSLTTNTVWPSSTCKGAVVVSNTLVVFPPAGAATGIGLFNPVTNTMTSMVVSPAPASSSYAYYGSTMLPNGNILFVPDNNNFIGIYNPITQSFSTHSGNGWLGLNTSNFCSGIVIPDGRTIMVPATRTFVGIYNYQTNSFTTVSVPFNNYRGGALLPDGRVLMSGGTSTNIGLFNPITNSFSTISGVPGGATRFIGALSTPYGSVILCPFGPTGSTQTMGIVSSIPPYPIENCIHPFYNKY